VTQPYRLGIINYTNALPILAKLNPIPGVLEFAAGHPTQMNQALLSGDVDLANISAAEFIRHAGQLRALPDFSISVLGPVYSVNLFQRCSWPELHGQRIAVTMASATSVNLLRVLLMLDGIVAELVPVEGELAELLVEFAAVLHIGDRALQEWYGLCGPISEAITMFQLPSQGTLPDGQPIVVTDLAMSWYEHTGMPFVFAVWASHRDAPPPPPVVQAMRQSRRWGVGHLAALAATESERLGLPERILQHYLWNFRYHLEAPDRRGLAHFASLLGTDSAELQFWQ
jgi:chorismate dehydratase